MSSDRQYVLKLFFFDTPTSQRALEGCITAYLYAAQDTGIVYAHLNRTDSQLPTVVLKGPAWKRCSVSLDQVRFALQRRATPLSEELLHAYQKRDLLSFRRKINEAFALMQKRSERGIQNADHRLVNNFGYIEKKVVEIDFGQYYYDPDNHQSRQEKLRALSHLARWVKKQMPEWKNEIDLRINTLVAMQ